MKLRSIILLVLALGCGLIAALGINQVLSQNAAPTNNAETVSIWVASNDLLTGDPIPVQTLKLQSWPKDQLMFGMLTETDSPEGRRPRSKIFAGEPIMEAKLMAKGEIDSPTGSIPPGHGVIQLKVDAVTSADLVIPGDRVDLIVHLMEGRGIQKSTTLTFLRRIKVFTVDNRWVPEESGGSAASTSVKSVGLLVTPEQAELITLASELGKIRFVLRNSFDPSEDLTKGTGIDTLTGNQSSDPNAPNPAELIKGLLGGKPQPDVAVATDVPEVDLPKPERMTLWEGDRRRILELRDGIWTLVQESPVKESVKLPSSDENKGDNDDSDSTGNQDKKQKGNNKGDKDSSLDNDAQEEPAQNSGLSQPTK